MGGLTTFSYKKLREQGITHAGQTPLTAMITPAVKMAPSLLGDVPGITSKETPTPVTGNQLKTVFVIVMENHNWSSIINSPAAKYINQTLLPQASFAENYHSAQNLHPSEPNYLWMEAGTSFGITDDEEPVKNHQSTRDHLVTYLDKAGITWKSYQEDINGKVCPLKNEGLYTPRHNPMVYFDDVTNHNDPKSEYCISHVRPFDELKKDLNKNQVPQYNFITPNICHSMHITDGCDTKDMIKNGDEWLSRVIPMIMDSSAYKQGGVIFITWDESEGNDDPIGLIILSPLAKGGGYSNQILYTHSSLLRTIEEIFNIQPFLGDAAKAEDLKDLFSGFP